MPSCGDRRLLRPGRWGSRCYATAYAASDWADIRLINGVVRSREYSRIWTPQVVEACGRSRGRDSVFVILPPLTSCTRRTGDCLGPRGARDELAESNALGQHPRTVISAWSLISLSCLGIKCVVLVRTLRKCTGNLSHMRTLAACCMRVSLTTKEWKITLVSARTGKTETL